MRRSLRSARTIGTMGAIGRMPTAMLLILACCPLQLGSCTFFLRRHTPDRLPGRPLGPLQCLGPSTSQQRACESDRFPHAAVRRREP